MSCLSIQALIPSLYSSKEHENEGDDYSRPGQRTNRQELLSSHNDSLHPNKDRRPRASGSPLTELREFCSQRHAHHITLAIPRTDAEFIHKVETNLCSPGDVANCSLLKPKQVINQKTVKRSVLGLS